MATCPCVSGCPFFNDKMANMPQAAEQLKKRFCQGDNSACARFMVFSALGKGRVPADLTPRQQDRAQAIIAAP